MGVEDLTLDEIFAELDAAYEAANLPPEGSFTAEQYAGYKGISRSTASARLRQMVTDGLLETCNYRGKSGQKYYRRLTNDSSRD